jgi:NAD(P)-dependent dehydrogenase (short-subunit alcohol dehydrogenase family)
MSDQVIRMLESTIAKVKEGKIVAVALAAQGLGLSTVSAFALGENGDLSHLVCAIERVKLRLLDLDDDQEVNVIDEM